MKGLKWVDARANNISQASIQKLVGERPDLELLFEEPVKQNIGIAPPIEKYVQTPTRRLLNANQETTMDFGTTVFDILPGSFLTKNGAVYDGEVELSYTEYLTPEDILISGITMTSDSASENLMFSSGGMFNLTAEDEKGNVLELNPAQPIKAEMYSSSANTDMNLYFLNEKTGGWEYKGKDKVDEPFKLDQEMLDSAIAERMKNFRQSDVVIVKNRYVPSLRNNGNLRTFEIKFHEYFTHFRNKKIQSINGRIDVKPKDPLSRLIANTTFLYDGDRDSISFFTARLKEMRKMSKKTYKRLRTKNSRKNKDYNWGVNFITQLDLTLDGQHDQIRLNFMFKDSLISMPVTLKSSSGDPKGRVKVFERFYKSYNRLKHKRLKDNRKLLRQINIIQNKERREMRELAKEIEERRQKLYYENQEFFNKQADKGSVIRSFEMSSFGVWNCDVRQRMRNPTALPRDFVSADGEEIEDPVEKIIIVDYDANGVVSFSHKKDAFFDGASKTAIVVFFSAVSVGIYQTWKKILNQDDLENPDQMPLKRLNITNMNVTQFQDALR